MVSMGKHRHSDTAMGDLEILGAMSSWGKKKERGTVPWWIYHEVFRSIVIHENVWIYTWIGIIYILYCLTSESIYIYTVLDQ